MPQPNLLSTCLFSATFNYYSHVEMAAGPWVKSNSNSGMSLKHTHTAVRVLIKNIVSTRYHVARKIEVLSPQISSAADLQWIHPDRQF